MEKQRPWGAPRVGRILPPFTLLLLPPCYVYTVYTRVHASGPFPPPTPSDILRVHVTEEVRSLRDGRVTSGTTILRPAAHERCMEGYRRVSASPSRPSSWGWGWGWVRKNAPESGSIKAHFHGGDAMIVVMEAGTTRAQADAVGEALQSWGYEIHPIYGTERTVIAAVGTPTQDEARVVEQVESLPGVERAVLILKPYRFASREYRPEKSDGHSRRRRRSAATAS